MAPVEYHYWGGDPFYTFPWAQQDIIARASYYNQGYVPSFRYDGHYIQDLFTPYEAFYEFFRWTLDSLVAIPSPIRINIDQFPSEDWDSVYVSFDVIVVDTIIDDTTPDLYLAVVEKNHRYPYPIGRWDYAFRDMIPDGDGEAISIQKGDSLHFEWAYRCTTLYNQDAIVTTIWVQNDTDASVVDPLARGKVLQAASVGVTDVSSVAGGETPVRAFLGQSSPNPFTTETRIGYSVSRAGPVRLSIYTPTGRLVTHLVDEYAEFGSHSAVWDGRDGFGREVGSGLYYYRLVTEGKVRTGRMVRLK